MASTESPYGPDLALIHHLGFGEHADRCAPGILELLQSVRARGGTVLELGCGSGALTRHLVDAGHRVIATDASPAMLALAREVVGGGAKLRRLRLPDDPLPAADAIVSVGHVLNYLPDEAAIARALDTIGHALRPGGVLAIDLCDLRWAEGRRDRPGLGRAAEDWAVITQSSAPAPSRYLRQITTFVKDTDGSWRRCDERHDNVLVDTSAVPRLLSRHGVQAAVGTALGGYRLPEGLVAIVGSRPSARMSPHDE